MKHETILLTLFLLHCATMALNGQTTQRRVAGRVTDHKQNPLAGVSVLLAGAWKGTTTDSTGRFVLPIPSRTSADTMQDRAGRSDTLILKISALGFRLQELKITPGMADRGIHIILKEEAALLQNVVISAGNFEASDEKKTTVLKPFELATTPTANPDVFSAIQELPGTSKVGESEGLFVRGGSASETKAIIDGMIVQDPFFSAVPGIAQKGRFSPLLFKGTAFSTGGYSAQYGQALSAVLVLNTLDLAQSSSGNLTLSTAGLSGNLTHAWEQMSLSVNMGYFNLQPSFSFNKQNYIYDKAPQGTNGNLVFRVAGKKNALFKLYASYSANDLQLQLPGKPYFSLDGKNAYLNCTYKKGWDDWILNTGFSYSHNADSVVSDTSHIHKTDGRTQGRIMLTRKLAGRSKIYGGVEGQYVRWENTLYAEPAGGGSRTTEGDGRYALSDELLADFIESEFYIGSHIAARAGIREEYSYTLRRSNRAPRFSVAWLLNAHSQLSLAYGDFYQLPSETYLYTDRNLRFENAEHYILNYQIIRNERTFRVEGYYKRYRNLVRELNPQPYEPFVYDRIPSGNFDNSGKGYARGIDLFWHDKKSIPSLDYWISYSYLDTKRQYANYPTEVMPSFAAHHNISLVCKYTVPRTTVNLGATYNYTSGRPCFNPNHAFLSDLLPPVHNLIVSGNYSRFYGHMMVALFVYADNILGIRNVYGYAWSHDGQTRYTLYPPAFRSVFGGVSITWSKHRSIMGIDF